MSKKEPLEDVVRRFECGGLEPTMTTPSRVVKLGAPQVRQMPGMKIQAQVVEEYNSKQRRRIMRRKIPTRIKMKRRVRKRWIKRKRKKVKMRKKKEKEKVDEAPPYPRYFHTTKCRQRLVLGMEFMVCIVFV